MQKWGVAMAKCKNCKHLKYKDDGRERYAWCPLIGDNPDLEFERFCGAFKKKTNADRIRSMTDEELTEFLYKFNDIDEKVKFCTNKKVCTDWLEKEDTLPDGWCKECLLELLKSEVGCE